MGPDSIGTYYEHQVLNMLVVPTDKSESYENTEARLNIKCIVQHSEEVCSVSK
jgi:hypothetical protein